MARNQYTSPASFDESEYATMLSRLQAGKSTETRPSDESLNIGMSSCVFADILLPGRGKPMEKAAAVIENGFITFVGPQSELPGRKL
ncbi:hypothetical protein BP6252_10513 [Coleophoma cylindrospora]|uniref:Uncharacterized protein n=1 Tax=Coleophoma cylindrospora TaxID=1849047 RepID=A0A3D8QSV5_9HELO|nr:hypothetical protein BP6252_10513 [Coleophoma cylindrospora]